jgi:GH15 family glucan-1,4-alpha-glucosidase
MCWAACDRLGNAAEKLGLTDRPTSGTAAPPRCAPPSTPGLERELGRFAATFEGDELDASLLQLVDLRFIDANDPRNVATVAAVEEGLRKGSYLLRYAIPDDFGAPQTAFNICTFWLIEALHLAGRIDEARDAVRGDAGPPHRRRPAVRGHRLRGRRAVGQLSADLFAGRP